MEWNTLLAPQCTPNQTGLLSEWSRLWRTSSKSAMKTKKTRTLLFCPTEPLLWITSWSSAELLNNRKFKTRVPLCQRALLNSTDHEAVKTKFITRQEKQAHYYNQNSGPPKKPLETDQPIRMYDHHSQTWEPGVIVKPAKQSRSYIIRSSSTGATYRRTRSQLRPDTTAVSDPQRQRMETPVYQGQQATSPAPISPMETSQKDSIAARPGSDDTAPPSNAPGIASDTVGGYVTRSGRTVTPHKGYTYKN